MGDELPDYMGQETDRSCQGEYAGHGRDLAQEHYCGHAESGGVGEGEGQC